MKSITEREFQRLFASDPDDGRDYLLKRAYRKKRDEEALLLFLRYFPATEELQFESNHSLKDLTSQDLNKRRKAASYLLRKACGNWTLKNKHWLADPRTFDVLIKATDDQDPAVAKDIICSLGHISRRYEFYDERVIEHLQRRFDEVDDSTRLEIIAAIPQFGGKGVWDTILKGFNCSPSKRKASAIAYGIHGYASKTLRSMIQRQAFFDRIKLELESCRNAETVDLWCRAVPSLRVDGSEAEMYRSLPKKFHKSVDEWFRRFERGPLRMG